MPQYIVSGAEFLINATDEADAVHQLEAHLDSEMPDVPVMGRLTARPARHARRPAVGGDVNVVADAGSVAWADDGLAAGGDVNVTASGGSVAIGGGVRGGIVVGDGNVQINHF